MGCEPATSALVAHVAVPPAVMTCGPQPAMTTTPSWNTAVPVRAPVAGAIAVTVAMRFTFTPVLDGFSDDTTLVVVAPWFTVCVNGADALVVKLASPLYMAVIMLAPTARLFTSHVAFPETGTAWAAQPAMSTPPTWKSTIPLRAPEAGAVAVTLAVKITFAPVLDGLTDEVSAVLVASRFTVWVGLGAVEPVKLASPL